MKASRKMFITLLCPLFVVGVFLMIQGCGGGGETQQQAQETQQQVQTEAQEKAEPEVQAHTEELALAGYACPMHPETASLKAGKCSVCGTDLKEAKLHYTCTMCADERAYKPGKCSHCGMDLVLRPAVEGKAPKPIH